MANKKYSRNLHDAVENYYQYNPDTLMPLMMLAMAAQEKLQVGNGAEKNGKVFCCLKTEEIQKYNWVLLNPSLKKRVKQAIADGHAEISAKGDVDDSLQDIYETFYKYDTYTVVQEYHHRIGRLIHHSSNEVSEEAHRQYATLCLAEALVNAPREWLKERFLNIANHILVKSGLQPERPRLNVAQTLVALLEYDGKGTVYNPFAGCAIAAAMLCAGKNLYADADSNDKLYAAARLLNYGMGGSNKHIEQRDSTEWLKNKKIDFVLSTYRGYISGKSAFDFCLSQCFETLAADGRYAGIVSPKDIFESQSAEMKEALRRDWVETIVLLPFGEVAVLINAQKSARYKKQVKLFDLTHPMLRRRPIWNILTDDQYAKILSVSDVKKKGFLRSVIVPEFEEREGFEIIKLGDIVSKLRKQTYSLNRVPKDERVLAYIDKTEKYDKFAFPWMNQIEKRPVSSLFAPVYHLQGNCLITNTCGKLEPRLFDADFGTAYFQDGYAFELKDYESINVQWLIEQLNEAYVLRQLHPYGMDEMFPETITEEQILNLKLYREIESEIDSDADKLSTGYVLHGENATYTIHDFLGHGYFGYTYSALAHNLSTGEQKEVVVKEFYPHRYFRRNGVRAVLEDENERQFIEDSKNKFTEEAKIMNKLGMLTDSHIVPAYEVFNDKETGTMYYVMPFYHDGSLEDLQNTGFNFTEDLILNHIVKPLCKALHIAHKAKVLHLDIKPENILVDEQGDAVLIDFGVAKQYDATGDIINRRGASSRSIFAAPELIHGNMVKFGSQTDIYGLASSIYYLIAAPEEPHPIYDFSDQDKDLREYMTNAGCSEKFIDAIISGLQFSATSRPKDAQTFLNLFPGCESIKL